MASLAKWTNRLNHISSAISTPWHAQYTTVHSLQWFVVPDKHSYSIIFSPAIMYCIPKYCCRTYSTSAPLDLQNLFILVYLLSVKCTHINGWENIFVQKKMFSFQLLLFLSMYLWSRKCCVLLPNSLIFTECTLSGTTHSRDHRLCSAMHNLNWWNLNLKIRSSQYTNNTFDTNKIAGFSWWLNICAIPDDSTNDITKDSRLEPFLKLFNCGVPLFKVLLAL